MTELETAHALLKMQNSAIDLAKASILVLADRCKRQDAEIQELKMQIMDLKESA